MACYDEHWNVSVHRTYEGALASWNKKRQESIIDIRKRMNRRMHNNNFRRWFLKSDRTDLGILACNDPEKFEHPGSFPTPRISEMELED